MSNNVFEGVVTIDREKAISVIEEVTYYPETLKLIGEFEEEKKVILGRMTAAEQTKMANQAEIERLESTIPKITSPSEYVTLSTEKERLKKENEFLTNILSKCDDDLFVIRTKYAKPVAKSYRKELSHYRNEYNLKGVYEETQNELKALLEEVMRLRESKSELVSLALSELANDKRLQEARIVTPSTFDNITPIH